MTGAACTRCHRPTDNAAICWDCTSLWRAGLEKLSDLMPELEVTIQRGDYVSHGIRHHNARAEDTVAVAAEIDIPARLRSRQGRITLAPHALPINLAASEFLTAIRRALGDQITALAGGETIDSRLAHYALGPMVGPYCEPHVHTFNDAGCGLTPDTCKQLHPDHVHDYTARGCGLDDTCDVPRWCWHESCIRIRAGYVGPVVACDWLRRHEKQMRRHDQAAGMVTTVDTLGRDLERAVDSSDSELFIGPCDAPDVTTDVDEHGVVRIGVDTGRVCGVDLYAKLGDKIVECSACGASYDIAERKAWLLESAREVWARPVAIAIALAGLDIELTAVKLNNWISRDRACYETGRAVQDPDGGWWNPHTGLALILAVAIDDELGGKPVYRFGDVMDRLDALRQASFTKDRTPMGA